MYISFSLTSFFCVVGVIFLFSYSVFLCLMTIWNVLVIFSRFALRIHSTTSFAWCIFLLIISYYWTNIINLPNVTSQHKLVVFIYFKWFSFFVRSMAVKAYEDGYSEYYGDRLKNISKSTSEEESKQLYRD